MTLAQWQCDAIDNRRAILDRPKHHPVIVSGGGQVVASCRCGWTADKGRRTPAAASLLAWAEADRG